MSKKEVRYHTASCRTHTISYKPRPTSFLFCKSYSLPVLIEWSINIRGLGFNTTDLSIQATAAAPDIVCFHRNVALRLSPSVLSLLSQFGEFHSLYVVM